MHSSRLHEDMLWRLILIWTSVTFCQSNSYLVHTLNSILTISERRAHGGQSYPSPYHPPTVISMFVRLPPAIQGFLGLITPGYPGTTLLSRHRKVCPPTFILVPASPPSQTQQWHNQDDEDDARESHDHQEPPLTVKLLFVLSLHAWTGRERDRDNKPGHHRSSYLARTAEYYSVAQLQYQTFPWAALIE